MTTATMFTTGHCPSDMRVEFPSNVARHMLRKKENEEVLDKGNFYQPSLQDSDWNLQSLFEEKEHNYEFKTESELYQALCLAPAFLSRQRRTTLSKRSRAKEEPTGGLNDDNDDDDDETCTIRKRSLPVSFAANERECFALEEKNNYNNVAEEMHRRKTNSLANYIGAGIDEMYTCTLGESHGIEIQQQQEEEEHLYCDDNSKVLHESNTDMSKCGDDTTDINKQGDKLQEVVQEDPSNTTDILQRRRQKKGVLVYPVSNYISSHSVTPTTVDKTDEKRLSLDSSLNLLNIPVGNIKQNRSTFPSRFGKRLARRFITPTQSTETMLQYAVTNQDYEMLKKILSTNETVCDINFLHPPGVSILHQACVLGDFSIVKLLIQKGADVRLKTWRNLSPTKLAAIYGHFDIAQLLLLTGADEEDVKNGFQIN